MDDTKPTEDFEMGSDPAPETPKINNYAQKVNDIKVPEVAEPKANPAGQAPAAAPAPVPAAAPAQAAAPTPAASPTPAQPQKTIGQAKNPQAQPNVPSPVNLKARKRALMGCLTAFGIIMFVFLILAFVFIGQASGAETSPIAKLLGVNRASFVNGLITMVHILFVLISLTLFVITMIGLFKTSMAKKDDKEAKKSALRTSMVAGIFLLLVIFVWMFVYIYLDSKRIKEDTELLAPIITDPEETLNLTAPVEIKFDASNVPIDKRVYQIIYYEWDFGDGDTGTSQIVTHKFDQKGKFDVLLVVTKRNKNTGEESEDTYTAQVTVDNQAITASFSADPQSGEAPLEVKFDASESVDPDGTISRYEWDLDDDGEFDDGTGLKLTHTFEKIGLYTVSLRVVSTTNEYNIAEKEIVVEEAKEPTAVITVVDEPSTYVTGIAYVFKGDESESPFGNIDKYEWDFSDSSKIKEGKSVSHSFTKSGTYEVTLKVTDEDGNEGEITKTITLGAPKGTPSALISTVPALGGDIALTGTVPFKVSFDASGTTDSDDNIVEYRWDFENDGEFDAYGEATSHTYTKEGTYTVKLQVEDADKQIGTKTMAIVAEEQGVMAIVKADEVEGTVPLTVKFDASGSSYANGQITSYKWDFGDKTAPKLGSASMTHKYTEIGSYVASVEVIGADNTSSKATINITVREIALKACFVSVFEEGPAPLNTTFDPGCATGSIQSYFWDFGDESTSTDVKPAHTFTEPGDYKVVLEITDGDSNLDKAQLTISVTE